MNNKPQPSEVYAPTVEVLYICEMKHVTTVKFHAQVKDFPKSWNCGSCHRKNKYIASASTPTDEYIPDPKKMSAELRNDNGDTDLDEEDVTVGTERYTRGHLQALHERRTNEELEALLQERLEWVRAHKVVY